LLPTPPASLAQTPLHEAAKRNDVAMMKLLMEHGAKVTLLRLCAAWCCLPKRGWR
jgi:ankyrin repeat protein